jgi:hypothetical protein
MVPPQAVTRQRRLHRILSAWSSRAISKPYEGLWGFNTDPQPFCCQATVYSQRTLRGKQTYSKRIPLQQELSCKGRDKLKHSICSTR